MLPHNIVHNINKDLFKVVEAYKNKPVTGKVLDFVYRKRHGIVSHGFEPDSMYRVFAKDKSVLILKVA